VQAVIPKITEYFELSSIKEEKTNEPCTATLEAPTYLPQAVPRSDIWEYSSQNEKMCVRGCYDLRDECFDEQYISVVETQRHLLQLGLLDSLPVVDLRNICKSLSLLQEHHKDSLGLISQLSDGLQNGTITVHRGLDTGFSLPDGGGHFWAVSYEDDANHIEIFVSNKCPDTVGTILHTFLAHRGVRRYERFNTEMRLFKAVNPEIAFHPRIEAELNSSSYSELLFLMEQIMVTQSTNPILLQVLSSCEKILVDEPTRLEWVKSHSLRLLDGSVEMKDLATQRLSFYTNRGVTNLPNVEKLLSAFRDVDLAIKTALYTEDVSTLERLSAPIIKAYHRSSLPGSAGMEADLYTMFFFCSMRRLAFDEVYLETTDRCPLFLQQHDQAAVFAELWMLGSQCEIYFGIKPRALGAIIYNNYRAYLSENPPPVESWNGKNVFTAYHKDTAMEESDGSIRTELKSLRTKASVAWGQLGQAGSLAIFCIPAIVDVCLLTFLGRGLYLTAFMNLEERVMANYALLTALIMTSGVTGWSGSTGGFYLYQSAFNNMNYFMVHRLSGGFMLTLIVSFCGFFAFSRYSWYAGFLYLAYLIILGTYLNLLGILATMHKEGSPFPSGRLVLGKCLSITLISPILTSFVNGHDVLIYLLVLLLFLVVLIWQFARLCDAWISWPEKVTLLKESEILAWYERTFGSEDIVIPISEKPTTRKQPAKSQVALASSTLMKCIENKLSKVPTSKLKDDDAFVNRLAEGHKYVVWLLEKESNGEPLPAPYSSTWLVQTKLALTNQQQLIRGLKEHSPFLLFRNAKYDIGQNVGLFLVALLDRWVAISMSANGHSINLYDDSRARYGIAFGLLYFLTSAIALDIVLQRYWGKTGRQSTVRLGSILDFDETESSESSVGRRRWLGAIAELVTVLFCLFGLMTLFVWIFVNDSSQVIMYFLYILGYTGVIIFQVSFSKSALNSIMVVLTF
jgi:hypothetical protein